MDRVVNFYARLPRGAAPETKATGLLGRYQARYFSGKNASAARELPSPLDTVLSPEIIVRHFANYTWTALAHAIGGILLVGYGLEYYFHLRK